MLDLSRAFSFPFCVSRNTEGDEVLESAEIAPGRALFRRSQGNERERERRNGNKKESGYDKSGAEKAIKLTAACV